MEVNVVGQKCHFCNIVFKEGDRVYYGIIHHQSAHKHCYERYQNQEIFKQEMEQLRDLHKEGWIKKDMTLDDLRRRPVFDPKLVGRK